MRFLIDEMPDNKRKCPFFVGTCYVDDCTIIKNYCKHTKKSCDLDKIDDYRPTCSGLKEIVE